MKNILNSLFTETVKYFSGDTKRIQHFTKVFAFAKMIGESEGLDPKTQLILEAAAVVHDIGIKNAEIKYGRADGKLQEQEGPAQADQLLTALHFETDIMQRVCHLVGNHHTYNKIDGIDFQILVEADLIVNFCEENTDINSIENAIGKVFRTETGKKLCRDLFHI